MIRRRSLPPTRPERIEVKNNRLLRRAKSVFVKEYRLIRYSLAVASLAGGVYTLVLIAVTDTLRLDLVWTPVIYLLLGAVFGLIVSYKVIQELSGRSKWLKVYWITLLWTIWPRFAWLVIEDYYIYGDQGNCSE